MSKTGTVKFFNSGKGFGFIVQEDGGPDLFVHANDCVGDSIPRDGDVVQFDAEWDDRKGKEHAVNVSGGTGSKADGKGFEKGKGFGKGKGKFGDKGKGKGKYGGDSYGGDSYGGGGYGGGGYGGDSYGRDAPY